MKRATAAAAIIAATLAGMSTGIVTSAAAQAAQVQEAKPEKLYNVNDARLWMCTGYIDEVNHKNDFTGCFTIRSDYGQTYFCSWDPEDFDKGDRIIFAADCYSPDPLVTLDPAWNEVIRVHSYNEDYLRTINNR